MGEADVALLERLRAGDEGAFVALVRAHHSSLLGFAETLVPSRAVAEEVVQDTWIGALRGLDKFEGRSSVKTWLFRILVNRARSAGARERIRSAPRGAPFDLFDRRGDWAHPPEPWPDDVDERLHAERVADLVKQQIRQLPAAQSRVLLLHDVEGMTTREVSVLLGLREGNVRVLLHRGRSTVRAVLDDHRGEAW